MREPPHQTMEEPLSTSPACQGYSETSVSTPPTILVPLWTTPQKQSQLPPRNQHYISPSLSSQHQTCSNRTQGISLLGLEAGLECMLTGKLLNVMTSQDR